MSLTKPSPTTALEAVNIMLGTIGESPVNSLENEQVVDAVVARDVLAEISREMQSEGWAFNIEKNYPLSRDLDGKIEVPINCIKVDFVRPPAGMDPVLRGSRLYDRQNHTYTFKQNVKAEVILLLPFNELPESARRYATIRAARVFADRMVGSDAIHSYTEMDEARARATLVAYESDTGDANILTGDSEFARSFQR